MCGKGFDESRDQWDDPPQPARLTLLEGPGFDVSKKVFKKGLKQQLAGVLVVPGDRVSAASKNIHTVYLGEETK